MKIRAPKTRSALAVLGAFWRLVAPSGAVLHQRLQEDGPLYRCDEIPEGLNRDEAYGLTLAIRWEEQRLADEDEQQCIAEAHEDGEHAEADAMKDALAARPSVVAIDGAAWLITLPGEPAVQLPTDRAVDITRALLEVRRTVRPCPRPFAPRDPVAELLQLHLRAMEAVLRGPTPIVTIYPP